MAMTAAPNNRCNDTSISTSSSSSTTTTTPPKSATLQQLNLWSKVLSRRRIQLTQFNSTSLSSVLKNINSATSSKRKEEEIRNFLEVELTSNFHKSVDSSLSKESRVKGLERVRLILKAIDRERNRAAKEIVDGRSQQQRAVASQQPESGGGGGGSKKRKPDRVEEESEEEESPPKRSRSDCNKAQQQQAASQPQDLGHIAERSESTATATSSTATITQNQKMGASLSSITSSTASSATTDKLPPAPPPPEKTVNDDDDDSDSDIEIIEVVPPPSSSTTASSSTKSASTAASASATSTMNQAKQNTAQQQTSTSTSSTSTASTTLPATPIKSESPNNFTYLPPQPPQLPAPPIKSFNRSITVCSDSTTPTYSASLQPRSACVITYDAGNHPTSGSILSPQEYHAFQKRLWMWDPYWFTLHDLSTITDQNNYSGGHKTTKIKSCSNLNYGQAPSSAVSITLPTIHNRQNPTLARKLSGISWGTTRPSSLARLYKDSEKRCIIRCLPLHRSPKDEKKRADTHLWPKGTFVQLNNNPMVILGQRKQQSHDSTLWKGMSHLLDLTPFISSLQKEFTVDLVAREIVHGGGGDSSKEYVGAYGVQIAICEYIGPDRLYKLLMREESVERFRGENYKNVPPLEIWSFEESLKVALKYINKQTVVIDDSDEEEDVTTAAGKEEENATTANSLTFSLICGFSMKAIETPVRGRNCKHMQCFDLRNFLHSNSTVSGGRWRCCVCEEYVCVSDLICCGLFRKMLEDCGRDVSGARDKVQFAADGTWRLMDVNKLRYQKKRPGGGGDAENGGAGGLDLNMQDDAKKQKNDHEIILL